MARRQDWQLELSRVVTSRSELEKIIRLTEGEKKAVDSLTEAYPLMASRHYLSLIDPDDENDPLRRTVVPLLDELKHRPGEKDDDVHADEARYQPCPGVIHRYPGKLLLIPTLACPSHCRFCFRKGCKVMHLSHDQGETALDYIRSNPSIRDVIITGGEPFILDDAEIHYWVSSVRAIRHVEIIRITTRFPVYIPSRITPDLVRMLAEHKPLYVSFSFVHPREITPDLERGISMMADAGIVLLQQGPILRGVNDDSDTLRRMYEKLASLRVLPYYAIWGIRAPGAEHFLIGGERASELIGALENRTSGFCVPHLITIARGDKVRMMGWSPEKEAVHLQGRDRGAPAGKAAPAIVPADARETPAEERQTR
jgi:lysine 2,3-aminomutase